MGFLLALFATTRSQSVQPWRFYDVGTGPETQGMR